MRPRYFLSKPTKKFSLQNGEKTERGKLMKFPKIPLEFTSKSPTCWFFFFFCFCLFSLIFFWTCIFSLILVGFCFCSFFFFEYNFGLISYAFFFSCSVYQYTVFFFFKNIMCYFFVLFNRDMMINLYKLYFQPNKKVFYLSTFSHFQPNINEGN